MRLCANENLSEETALRLRGDGHDVLWIRESAPGSSDMEVLARAQAERRLLLTFDRDFGELLYRQGATASCGVVLFRIFDEAVVVGTEKTDANGGRAELVALASRWLRNNDALQPGVMRTTVLTGQEIPVGGRQGKD